MTGGCTGPLARLRLPRPLNAGVRRQLFGTCAMIRHFNFLIAIFSVIPLIPLADYTVDCEGYNSETSAYVYGECSNGEFEGYDSETGHYVYGDCEFDGDLEAYDSETGEYVYGECEGE